MRSLFAGLFNVRWNAADVTCFVGVKLSEEYFFQRFKTAYEIFSYGLNKEEMGERQTHPDVILT